MNKPGSVMLILELPEPPLRQLADRYASEAEALGIQVLEVPLERAARVSFDTIKSRIESNGLLAAIIHVAVGWPLSECETKPCLVSPRDHLALWDFAEYSPRDMGGSVAFLDISHPYDEALLHMAEQTAREMQMTWASEVIASHPCPWILTPTEKAILQRTGCQTVTRIVPLTAKLARAFGIPVLGILALPEWKQDATFTDIGESLEGFLDRLFENIRCVGDL